VSRFFFLFTMIRLVFGMLAQGCGVLGAFLSNVQGELRAVCGAAGLHLRSLFLRKARGLFALCFHCLSFSLVLGFFLLEDSAADKSICLRFLVFGFGQICGQRGDLILV